MPEHLVRYGKHRVRRNYARIKKVLGIPNLTDVQTESYKWFLDKGIDEMFKTIMPITDFKGNLTLDYIGYKLGTPKYTEAEARDHEANYTAPMHVTLELTNHQTGEIKTQDVYFGDLPLMTSQGTFIINGAERVVVSQLVRSPGVFFHKDKDKKGRIVYGATIIPNRGAWMEFLNDAKGLSYVRIDRTRKLPITELVRALGFGSDKEISDILGSNDSLSLTLEKDVHKNPKDTRTEEALKDIYARLRPGEPKTAESARHLLTNRFFDHKRYSTAPVGRYKINEKLNLKNQLLGLTLAETLANPDTGEILAKKGTKVNNQVLAKLKPYLERKDFKAYTFTPSSDAVDPKKMTVQIVKVYSKKNPGHVVPVVAPDNIPLSYTHLTNADIISAMNYFFNMQEHLGSRDDIDHLGNRRIRRVGELLQNQFRIGLARMERVVRERMSIQDAATVTPQKLVNIRPVTAAIKQFFGSSQLSQFMDQNNPLGELTHKRRLSALGPGGLTRDRAGFEVRDVHYTHYGRICPIETPSGPNIGLINSLATYAKVNKYGFIETPYRRVSWKTHKVTDKIDYLTADKEDKFTVAEANTPLNDDGSFKNKTCMARHRDKNFICNVKDVDYMDVSPRQVISIGCACVAFLEHDDSNRAMMGTNMQRQSVPLVKPHSPVVATGVEYKIGHDSGVAKICKHPGTVEYVDAREIRVRRDDGALDKYVLTKFQRSNAGKNYNQTPIVKVGDHVDADEIIADGPAMQDGELALGQNPLIAFMTWHGYNFEDAVAISERMDIDDVYSSIHLQDYKSEARDTKLGPEEITREIPNVSQDALKNLDENGIVRIGAEVHTGDILVGKVTPKGMTELSSEERLLHAIFGEKAREVRDTSLRVPHGAGGIVQDIKVFTRENGDELPPGTNEMVRVYLAQYRKIQVGDKLAGRHGNKSTISIVIPENDMPYMPNGEPVDVLLSPMGVPSRMNIGQVLELHLGMAARKLGIKIDTPVFEGASNAQITDALREAACATDGKTIMYSGETGEPYNKRIAVGVMNYLKLDHMVDDKIHARAIGPYSLVTQQPLGGKAQFGGQRFGEMEVWALEAYGAAYTLQEILTYKSDDVVGRVKAYEAIVKGEPLPNPGVPESFRVLVKELEGLGLDMRVLDKNHNEIDLSDEDNEDQDVVNVDALSKFAEKQEQKKQTKSDAKSDSKKQTTDDTKKTDK